MASSRRSRRSPAPAVQQKQAKRAQTGLRVICKCAAGTARIGREYHAAKCCQAYATKEVAAFRPPRDVAAPPPRPTPCCASSEHPQSRGHRARRGRVRRRAQRPDRRDRRRQVDPRRGGRLLLGGRASSDLVRTGEDVARVEALFDDGDGEVVLRREITAQGRSRAFVNGALATAGALRELSDRLDRAARPARASDAARSREPSRPARRLRRPRDDARRGRRGVRECCRRSGPNCEALQLDERAEGGARSTCSRSSATRLPGAQLRAGRGRRAAPPRARCWRTPRAAAAERRGYAALYEQTARCSARLTAVWRRVGELAALDPRLRRTSRRATPSSRSSRTSRSSSAATPTSIDASPARLQEVEDRLALLERLKRKYGPTLADVIAHHDDAACRSSTSLAGLDESAADRGREELGSRERGVPGSRRERSRPRAGRPRSGSRRRSNASLGELAMARTQFEVRFDDADCDGGGVDARRHRPRRVLRLAEPRRGPPAAGAHRVRRRAVARDAGAPQPVGQRRNGARTLIFDEVDAGIGGRAADDVGRKLQALGATPRCSASRTCRRSPRAARRTSRSARTCAAGEP